MKKRQNVLSLLFKPMRKNLTGFKRQQLTSFLVLSRTAVFKSDNSSRQHSLRTICIVISSAITSCSRCHATIVYPPLHLLNQHFPTHRSLSVFLVSLTTDNATLTASQISCSAQQQLSADYVHTPTDCQVDRRTTGTIVVDVRNQN